jgi:GNAT superfamily N-acetyltransferase
MRYTEPDGYGSKANTLACKAAINAGDFDLFQVAIDDGELAGALWLAIDLDCDFTIVVNEDYQGQGIASSFIELAEDMAAEEVSEMRVTVVSYVMKRMLEARGYSTKEIGDNIWELTKEL